MSPSRYWPLWLLLTSLPAQAGPAAKDAELDRCFEAAPSTHDQLACLRAATAREDARLNRAYRDALARIEAFRRPRLREVQRLWIRYRDARCHFFYHEHSGSSGLLDVEQCLREETRRRADELERLY